MSARVAAHIRANVVGYIAIFLFAIGGTGYATHTGGANTIDSVDIINGEVKRDDIAADAVRTGKVLNETLLDEDIATGAVGGAEVKDGVLTHRDLGPGSVQSSELADDSVGFSELAPSAFNSEISPHGNAITGFSFGIADNAIQSNEVSPDSLQGGDINEGSLGPSLDVVATAGNDSEFGPTITSHFGLDPTNVLTDTLPAGLWVVFAELQVTRLDNNDHDRSVDCFILTDDTEREFARENIEANPDPGDNKSVRLQLTAVFPTNAATTLRLACRKGGDSDEDEMKPLSANLVAIPVDFVG